ncbi:hypothetical protein JCM14076_25080 [Methylosoma difficile]
MMTQELKQRIIGAIVVTALAAIFVPMLFDDPIDNSGQSVSELAIPENQVDVVEEESPLPNRAEDVVKMPEGTNPNTLTADSINKASPDLQAPADGGLEPDQLPGEEDFGGEEPSDGLDTGEVEETPSKPVIAIHKPSELKPNTAAANKPKPAPAVKAPAVATATPALKPISKKPATDNQHWTVQAGSFSKKENAQAMFESLKKQGIAVTLESKDSLYRLKAGSGLDKKRALAIKAKLDQLKIPNMLLPE